MTEPSGEAVMLSGTSQGIGGAAATRFAALVVRERRAADPIVPFHFCAPAVVAISCIATATTNFFGALGGAAGAAARACSPLAPVLLAPSTRSRSGTRRGPPCSRSRGELIVAITAFTGAGALS